LIIACPECTSPFQVLDDQIAALVQIECPNCKFRMILDFEAANDASLREEGMQMAQGFRDEASYRAAVGADTVARGVGARTPAAERPSLRAVPDEPVVEAQPVVERPPVRPQPVAEPVAEPVVERPPVRPVAPPEKPPVRVATPIEQPVRQIERRPTLIAHTPPPPRPVVATPAPERVRPVERAIDPVGPVGPVGPAVESRVETHIGPPPTGPEPGPKPELEAEAEIDVDIDEPEVAIDEPEVAVDEPEVAAGLARTPPHTPGREPASEAEVPARPTPPPEIDDEAEPELEPTKPRRVGLQLFALLILLLAGGLMTWSLITTRDPNPIPMLQELFDRLSGNSPKTDGAKTDGAKTDGAKTE
jgi:DNA-directed RNA polymerase subunit RPC12/RpoP